MGIGSLKFIDYLSRTGVDFNQNPMGAAKFFSMEYFCGSVIKGAACKAYNSLAIPPNCASQLADFFGIRYQSTKATGLLVQKGWSEASFAEVGALLASGLLAYGRVDEVIETAQNACIYDDKIYLPRVILAIAHCAQSDAISAKIAW